MRLWYLDLHDQPFVGVGETIESQTCFEVWKWYFAPKTGSSFLKYCKSTSFLELFDSKVMYEKQSVGYE